MSSLIHTNVFDAERFARDDYTNHPRASFDSTTESITVLPYVQPLPLPSPWWRNVARQFIPVCFAVFINLLDAVTFGTCFFPPVLGSRSGLAIEVFLISTVAVQAAFLAMSSFQCGLGTSMAENIPFVHTIATGIFYSMRNNYSTDAMMPTVLVAICVSTLLNGLLFYLVGALKLGYILHYFPRHVIMGMTLGFGIFLLRTGFEVSAGVQLAEGDMMSNLEKISSEGWLQFVLVCIAEALLRGLAYVPGLKHSLVAAPLFMFMIPVMFYVVVALTGSSFATARDHEWLFPLAPAAKWYELYLYFDLSSVDWAAVFAQLPTMISLAIFTLLLVPIRIPTLAMVTGDEIDFNTELKAQGVGNIASAIVGGPHNYLSYSNSVFYYNVGGKGKSSQSAITIVTLALFFVGPQIINFVPRVIAGVIMMHLSTDLVYEAIVASRGSLDAFEYCSVILVGVVVTLTGFVPGLLVGVVVACLTFVIQSSKASNIRGVFSGEVVRSNTDWPERYRDKLEAGLATRGIYVIQLQGQIFFGNVQQVVIDIEKIIIDAAKDHCETKLENINDVAVGQLIPDKLKMETSYQVTNSPTQSRIAGLRRRSISSDVGGFWQSNVQESPRQDPVTSSDGQYVVLDCSFVTGMDANAVDALLRLRRKLTIADVSLGRPECVLSFAGLERRFQDIFSIMEEEFERRFSNKDQPATESTPLLSREASPARDMRMVTPPPRITPVDTDAIIPPPPADDKISPHRRTKVSPTGEVDFVTTPPKSRPLSLRAQSCPPDACDFHNDVNTALQAVEEHIIESISTPKAAKSNLRKSLLRTKLAVKTAGLTTNALQSSISKLSLSSYEEISPTASDLKSGTSSASQKFDFHPIGEATEVDERTLPEILTGVTEVDSPLARTSGRVSAGSTNDLLALAKNLEKKKLVRKMVFNLDSSWTEDNAPMLKRLANILLKNVRKLVAGESLWHANEEATEMGLLISGNLKAVIITRKQQDMRTLQIIVPGSVVGELGLLSGGCHSRTLVATKGCEVGIISKEMLKDIEMNDRELFTALQKLALKTAASRSNQLMLFNAGSLGPF